MSLVLLFLDELQGFYKSKVMLVLWVGMPALVVLLHLWRPDLEGEMPLATFATLITSSISGTLASAMLAVSIIHEKSRQVFELYLVRPVRRRDIILAKFFAVFTCVTIAGALAVAVGYVIDRAAVDGPADALVRETVESFALSLATTGIASSAGVLIGVISPSVLVGVILVIYGGNQVVGVGLLPVLLTSSARSILTMLWGGLITLGLLALSIFAFDRKQF